MLKGGLSFPERSAKLAGRHRSCCHLGAILLIGVSLLAASGCRQNQPAAPTQAAAPKRMTPERSAHWHNNRGVALMEEGKLMEAEQEFLQALEAVPEMPLALYNMAVVEALQGKLEAARQRIFQYAPKLPAEVNYHATYLGGWLADKQEQYRPSFSSFASAALNFPYDTDVILRLVRAYLKAGEYESLVEQTLPAFIAREPYLPELYEICAQAWIALDRPDKAAPYQRKAKELGQRYRPLPAFAPLDNLGPLGQPLHAAEPFTSAARQERLPALRDVAASAGITFRHGGSLSPKAIALWRGESLPTSDWETVVRWELPAALGSGAAFGDLDNDGDLDLYVANAGLTPASCSNALYRNNGDGTFTDITAQARVGGSLPSLACIMGDVDKNGYLDIYVTNAGPNALYLNRGDGTFREVAQEWGVAGNSLDAGAALADLDEDGDLDLYVCGLLDLGTRPTGATFTLAQLKGYPNRLYLNQGDRFQEVAASLQADGGSAQSLSVTITDLEGDRDLDLIVTHLGSPPSILSNERGLPFLDRSSKTFGKPTKFRSFACNDFNQDGFSDGYLTGGPGERGQVAVNRLDRSFELTFQLPATVAATVMTTGSHLLDLDGDGVLDLLVAQANLDPMGGGALLALRNNTGIFEDISERAGLSGLTSVSPRGLAIGDYDNDGDPDVAVVAGGQPLLLLRNDVIPAAHWLKVRLQSRESAPQGMGAQVEVKSDIYWQVKEIRTANGFPTSEAPEALFTLGDIETLDFVRVFWPSGRRQALTDVPINQVLTLEEPQG